MIPNRKIAGEILHNYGEIRQLDLSVNVAYGTDLDAAVGRDPGGARGQSARAEGSGAAGAGRRARRLRDLDRDQAVGHGAGLRAPAGEINPAVLDAFRERGIEVPFPTVMNLRAPVAVQ